MLKPIPRKSLYFAVILVSCLAWAGALIMQHVFGMEPCSLCILQRWALTGVLLGAIVGLVLERRQPRKWGWLTVAIPAAAGLVVSVKHLVLQLSPPSGATGCGFGGAQVLELMPLTKALPALFAGSGDCATLPPVLGLPLPAWTTMLFLALIGLSILGCNARCNSPKSS